MSLDCVKHIHVHGCMYIYLYAQEVMINDENCSHEDTQIVHWFHFGPPVSSPQHPFAGDKSRHSFSNFLDFNACRADMKTH